MTNILFILCICFIAIQQETKADNCNTQQLKPDQPLLITIFDNNYEADKSLWPNVCKVINKFPSGLVTMEYRPGALVKGTAGSLTCGSGTCDNDQYEGCELIHYQYINDCSRPAEGGVDALKATVNCYCNQEANQLLLENAKLRASWNIPENAIPALAFNKKYDSCAKTKTEKEIHDYLCKIYQNAVAPCS